jgi:GSH-dependent disulfide-bond oxidoreductase
MAVVRLDESPFDKGRCMIDLYYWTTPNGHKITMFLEEAGLDYTIKPVNISKGDQFRPDFLKISPNNRMPAIVDHAPKDGGPPISVFESGAILVYLAGKTGKFMPRDLRGQVQVMEWAVSGPWQGKTTTSPPMRRRSCPTPSTATCGKRAGYTRC